MFYIIHQHWDFFLCFFFFMASIISDSVIILFREEIFPCSLLEVYDWLQYV